MSAAREILGSMGDSSTKAHKNRFRGGVYRAMDFANGMVKGFKEGKRRGETTNFKTMDMNFTWKRGFLYAFSGFPQHGKTEVLRQLALAKSIHNGWKWCIFDPESMSCDDSGNITPDEIFDSLAHSLVGKSTDPAHFNQMSMSEYEWAIEFLNKHFVIVYPDETHTPETILEYFLHANTHFKCDGYITDPWNKLIHNYGGLLDEYLAGQFKKYKDFALKNSAVNCIVEHPKGGVYKLQDGSWPVPNEYSLRGGAMWNNSTDCLTILHRPNIHIDYKDPHVDMHILKMKNQKLNGFQGTVHLEFNRKENRHYQMDGTTPLQVLPKLGNSIFKSVIPNEFLNENEKNKSPF